MNKRRKAKLRWTKKWQECADAYFQILLDEIHEEAVRKIIGGQWPPTPSSPAPPLEDREQI